MYKKTNKHKARDIYYQMKPLLEWLPNNSHTSQQLFSRLELATNNQLELFAQHATETHYRCFEEQCKRIIKD